MKNKLSLLLLLLILLIGLTACAGKDVEVQYQELIESIKSEGIIDGEYIYKVQIENIKSGVKEEVEYRLDVTEDILEERSQGNFELRIGKDINQFNIYEEKGLTYIKRPDNKFIRFSQDNEFINDFLRANIGQVTDLIKADKKIKEMLTEENISISEDEDIQINIDLPPSKTKDIMENIVLRNIGFEDIKRQAVENIKAEVEILNKELSIKITEEEIIKLVDEEMRDFEEKLKETMKSLNYTPLNCEIIFNGKTDRLEERISFTAMSDEMVMAFHIEYLYKGASSEEVETPIIDERDVIEGYEGLNAITNYSKNK